MQTSRMIRLPDGFDPTRDCGALNQRVLAELGQDWTVRDIDADSLVATVVHQPVPGDVTVLELASEPRPSDGDRIAQNVETVFPGQVMTRFDPHLWRVEIRPLTEDERRCRGALAAGFGVKPWDIDVRARPDGGYRLRLHGGYVASRHYAKLVEVTTQVVGRPGWYVTVDPHTLRAEIIPAELPTFPAIIPYPHDPPPAFDLADRRWAQIPIGWRLAQPGEPDRQPLTIDTTENLALQVSGIKGGGKGVTVTALMAGMIARGWQVGLIDAVKWGVDYIDFQPYVGDNLWASSVEQVLPVLQIAYQRGQERKALVRESRVQRWDQLPADLGLRPIMIIVDEGTSLIESVTVPKGLPKDSPVRLAAEQENTHRAMILRAMVKIVRELRFVGVALCFTTQQASVNTGVPTELRNQLDGKFLMGVNPSDSARRLALADADSVPRVPEHIISAAGGVGKGVGVYQLNAQPPGVFKAFYSPPADIATWLASIGTPTTSQPEPTPEQIRRYAPDLDGTGGNPAASDGDTLGIPNERAPSGRPAAHVRAGMGDTWDIDPETGRRATGHQRANLARHLSAQQASDNDPASPASADGDDGRPPWNEEPRQDGSGSPRIG